MAQPSLELSTPASIRVKWGCVVGANIYANREKKGFERGDEFD